MVVSGGGFVEDVFQPARKQVADMGVIEGVVDHPPIPAGADDVQVAQDAQLVRNR